MSIFHQAPNKIDTLYEITNLEYRYIDNNVEALRENINDDWYITLKNEQGDPLFIFNQETSYILPNKRSNNDKSHVLLKIYLSHYLLIFPDRAEARKFSNALLEFIKPLHLGHIFRTIKDRFLNNPFRSDSQDTSE